MTDINTLKQQLLNTARAMNEVGLNQGAAGNVSVRVPDGFLITPTGMLYEDCTFTDMVHMSMDGDVVGSLKPSSEWRFHRDLYANRLDAEAVVHVHSSFATTLACVGDDIPSFHYMIAVAGGKTIRCAPYYTFGTQELSNAVVDAMVDRKACLMGNHGMLAMGADLKQTLAMTVEVEKLCEIYWRVLQVGGGKLISDKEMDHILKKFETYGQFDK